MFPPLNVRSHLIPVGLCGVSVHTSFGFVDKVAKGIHFQRAVKIYRTQAALKVGNDRPACRSGHGGEMKK